MEYRLRFCPDTPPLAVLAAAAVGGVTLVATPDKNISEGMPPAITVSKEDEIVGAATLLRFVGRVSPLAGFYGSSPLLAAQVDEWLEYAPIFTNGAEFERACAYIDSYLSLRTFVVGYDVTIADVAIWTALGAAGPRWDSILRSPTLKYPNLIRWYKTAGAGSPELAETLKTYRRGGVLKPQSKGPVPAGKEKGVRGVGGEKGGKGGAGAAAVGGGGGGDREREEGPADIDLPGAVEGEVVTRFPPEPSGYLHIGHAKAALMNKYFAEKYKGKMIIRFDDTNPSKEKDEFVDSILVDLETLGVRGDRVTYTSDYFEELQAMCVKLIEEGKAYADDTCQETMRHERMEGIESKHRNNSVQQNLAMWRDMVTGNPAGEKCCIRGKIDMQATNKTLRDPVYYRCNSTPHHRVGTKYRVYPTYDFACPYVDSIEGITHALRSSEYHDRNDQFYRVLQDMGLRKVHVCDFSRLNFQYTLLSKRKLQWFVEQGAVEGWNDPRFPTVQGIVRRGLTVQALKDFILSQGASKNLNLMEWDKIWTMNKKIIDPVCPRHTAVQSEGRVLLTLTDGPRHPFVRMIPRHKKYAPAGDKATTFSNRIWLDQADAAGVREGEEVTLMDWGNAVITKKEGGGGGVIALEGHLHLEGSVKSTKWKLTWLADMEELVQLALVEVDHLITKKKLEETDEFTQFLNPRTKWENAALGDPNLRNVRRGEIIQLERKGYFICDVPFIRANKPMVLISIPDGRQKAVVGEGVANGVGAKK